MEKIKTNTKNKNIEINKSNVNKNNTRKKENYSKKNIKSNDKKNNKNNKMESTKVDPKNFNGKNKETNISTIDKKININIKTNKNKKTKNKIQTQFKNDKNEPKFRFIPLGGLDEIGKNINIFDYDGDMVILDCGMSFPEEDMLGIDVVIPDFDFIKKNKDKIKGLFITHGHEDHIGAVPYLLKEVSLPVYGAPFTIELIKNKLKEHKIKNADLHVVTPGEIIQAGKMSVEFISSTHSIPDSCMINFKTPLGNFLHTGDFKIDMSPVDKSYIDLGRVAELGNEGIVAMFSDSTNSEKDGFTPSESTVAKTLEKYIRDSKKRIIIAQFASNVSRIHQIIKLAVQYGRKVAISGRSMENAIKASETLNYIDAPKTTFIDLSELGNYPDEKTIIITTGSQGEPMSALSRIANGSHSQIKLKKSDLILLSATPVPGNEPSVTKLIDSLLKKGVEVIYSGMEHVHVSGHACKEEQKLMISLAKPKFFVPVHGNTRHLYAHRKNAKEVGYTEENILVGENGSIFEFTKDTAKITGEKVKTGKIFVDGLGIGDVGNIVLRDRQHLSQDGLIIAILQLDSNTGELEETPDIITRGFVYTKDAGELLNELKEIVVERFKKVQSSDWNEIKGAIRSGLARHIFKKTKRDPMVIPVIVEI